jgi:hypothetical protein
MAIELIELVKNTRGVNSRKISYKAIGKWVTKTVEKESTPVLDAAGNKTYDAEGKEVRRNLGKDAEGKLITVQEEVPEFVTEGVLDANGDGMADALMVVNGDEQVLLDCFAEGFNERAYNLEANKDELDDFLRDMSMDEDQKTVFKRTARQLNRGTGVSILDAAELIKGMLLKKQAAQAANQAAMATV